MNKDTLSKANDLHNKIQVIEKEIRLLEDGNMRCDLGAGEGCRWEPVKGLTTNELKNVIENRLLEKKGKLLAQFQQL